MFRLQAELDGRAKEFIECDRTHFVELEKEKESFIRVPEDHPDYNDEWRRFYSQKCFQRGMKVQPASLKDEWAAEWEFYLKELFDRRLTTNREDIMKRLRLNKDEIEDYIRRQKLEAAKVPASPVSSEDNIPGITPSSQVGRPGRSRDLEFSRDGRPR